MSDVVATRVHHSGLPRGSRNVEERLMVRFPSAWRALAALVQRLLSPRSRLKRALLRRAIASGWDAAARRDFELMLVRYAPDVEVEFDPEFEALGLGGTFRGRDGLHKLIEGFSEAWEEWRVVPEVILDMGDRLLVLGGFRLPGTASGLEFEREFAQLLTPYGGLVTREQEFFSWAKGLQAAGLDPDAIAVPLRAKQRQTNASARSR